MKTGITLERIETDQGVIKIEGNFDGAELVVHRLWIMSTDGWEELERKCPLAEAIFKSSADKIIDRTISKYGSSGKQVTRVIGV